MVVMLKLNIHENSLLGIISHYYLVIISGEAEGSEGGERE